MNFINKKALITGASSGIGCEFAKQLHAQGANVTLVARREGNLRVLADELCKVRPNSAEIRVADLSDPRDAAHIADLLRSTPFDILVNNAGRGSFGHFEEIDINSELEMIRLNCQGTIQLAHAVIPGMKQRRSGIIISVSSISAFQPLAYMATYAATKAFNFVHSMGLWAELRKHGVRVITLCPGPTGTEFAGAAKVPGSFSNLHCDDVRAVVRSTLTGLDLGLPFIVPGWRSWGLSLTSRLLPRALTTWLTEKIMWDTLKRADKLRQ